MSNSKKILSVILALILALSSITIMPLSAAAAQVEAPAQSGDSPYSGLTLDPGKLYFDAASAGWWSSGSTGKVAFDIIDNQGNAITSYGGKNAIGTATAGADGIFEYDVEAKTGVTLTPGVQYWITFYAVNGRTWGASTYPVYFTTDCLGHVAYATGAELECQVYDNPTINGKEACFDGIDPTVCGPVMMISNDGNVVGECLTAGKTTYDLFVEFISIIGYYNKTRLEYARENVLESVDKTEQELIDDIADGLGLSKEDVSRAFSETGVETTWSPDAEPATEPATEPAVGDYVLDPADYERGYAAIASYRGNETVVEVPSEIDGYKILDIGVGAFQGNTAVTKVTLPDTIVSMKDYAFKGCTSLSEINIPEKVAYPGISIFEGCTSLTEINIPKYIGFIGKGDFKDCSSLTEVTIPGTVHSADESAFEGCTSLTDLYVNGDVKLDEKLFGNSAPPENLTIHGYTNSSAEIFANKNNIPFVSIGEIPESDHYRYSINNGKATLNEYSGYQKIVEISDTYEGCPVTMINASAFSGNTEIEEIILPDSLTEIYNYYEYPTERPVGTFSGCTSLKKINIPDGVTELLTYTFKGCTSLTEIAIPASVTSIDSSAFDTSRPLTIYSYEGSAAQTYADQYENFTFVPLSTVTDESGITADVTSGVTLDVEDITDTIESYVIPEGETLVAAYDVNLVKDGEAVQPANVVTVKIPCDDPDAKVYRQEADGTLTDMKAVYRDGYLVFKTTHFSVYIVATAAEVDLAICGDADGNGEVTIMDVTCIQRYLVHDDPEGFNEAAADVDGDGSVTSLDATWIQRSMARIDVPYPIGEII